GTTFDGRYVDANGKGGNFEEKLLVYGREDQPCTRCGTKLQNVKIGGRSTVFCPHCQHFRLFLVLILVLTDSVGPPPNCFPVKNSIF
ncbi:hypothetical protein IJI99_00640, partial [bacterium]|nr:hypothetical protein [bacterium]